MANIYARAAADKLIIPKEVYNALIDLLNRGAGATPIARGPGGDGTGNVVMVSNASGADVEPFGILGIDTVIPTPADNLGGFQQSAALSGVTPATASHTGKFVIMLDGAPAGTVGRGLVAGVGIVQVNMVASGDRWADVKDADATQLQSGSSGSARILYAPSGTGTKWCVVRVGSEPSGPVVVKVYKDGGVAGNATTNCNYTYTIKDLSGTQLATMLTPATARYSHVAYTYAADGTWGLACLDEAGAWVLLIAFAEIAQLGDC